MKSADVVIAGGGIIGLSLALEMASAGSKVAVIERGRAMGESSWAAAGMLAAHDPGNPAGLLPLSRLSLQLYPEYLGKVSELSGRDVAFRTQTTLQAAGHGEGTAGWAAAGMSRRLDGAQVQGYVEGLVPGNREFWLLQEQSLDPRDLCATLPLAAKAAGVALVEDTAVNSIDAGADGVEVRTSAGLISGAEFVDCRGAWAREALRVRDRDAGPSQHSVRPRKGQMVAVEISDPTLLRVVVRTPEIYLVPRGDGRVVIGATVEDAGFDRSIDPAVTSRLLTDASELWPPLQPSRVTGTWAGIRPGSIDDLPLLGPDVEPHCWLATGHFRNGILLAPATALLMRRLLEGQRVEAGFEAFFPQRFLVKSPSLK